MTKTILITELTEIKSIKASCKHCGFSIQVSVASPQGISEIRTCPSCQKRLPAMEIMPLLHSLKTLQCDLKSDEFLNMDISIETDVIS